MRAWLAAFMLGRNGVAYFNKHLFRTAAAIAALDLLFLRRIGLVPVLIAGYALFRTLSRNLPARQAEDLLVRGKYSRVKANLSGAVQRAKQSRDYRFFSCPGCRSCLRVPRGKGRIQVTCPRCGHRFDRRS